MNPNIKIDKWKIIEDGFDPQFNRASESVFSIGNGHMGQRANFEEKYSGESMQGNYVAGIYYPDKTRVGWWKNGYPEYFAKVLNSPAWTGINIRINGEELDLAKCKIESFRRELDMKNGTLSRNFVCETINGIRLEVSAARFVSMDDHEIAAIEYKVRLLSEKADIEVEASINADVTNEDANYDEVFWEEIKRSIDKKTALIITSTRKTEFHLATAIRCSFIVNGKAVEAESSLINRPKYVSHSQQLSLCEGDELIIHKYAAILSSKNNHKNDMAGDVLQKVEKSQSCGYMQLLKNHQKVWSDKWDECDVIIEGDDSAQQGIRFNIFHLYQTYTGDDAELNIGPKGFTGEKYGGSTYWDTEAFALPFYLNTADSSVARNLLLYRYNHLGKAIENAGKLGFTNGAALYPMVTMNGEECHNEWEITFEEIHRNGAIAYAIYRYIKHTEDEQYLIDYGLEVLIAISRFWSQRVNFSTSKQQYVILGVTGPNEYENNVNNNWYTNIMAGWTMRYTIQCLNRVETLDKNSYNNLISKLALTEAEKNRWKEINNNMYYPVDDQLKVFLQQDGYLDKELLTADDLDPSERPINQHWSWDRILRSCFIKQADVLQGIYQFEDDYDKETIKRNFDFYEPRTLHESSLSPSIYSIMASSIAYTDRAYELYLRAARLDLDDYNSEVVEGLHITSMAGTWLAVVEGFGGVRIRKGKLHLKPSIPEAWKYYSFKMRFKNCLLDIAVHKKKVRINNLSEKDIPVVLKGKDYIANRERELVISV